MTCRRRRHGWVTSCGGQSLLSAFPRHHAKLRRTADRRGAVLRRFLRLRQHPQLLLLLLLFLLLLLLPPPLGLRLRISVRERAAPLCQASLRHVSLRQQAAIGSSRHELRLGLQLRGAAGCRAALICNAFAVARPEQCVRRTAGVHLRVLGHHVLFGNGR